MTANKIVLSPTEPEYSLLNLLKKVTKKNCHGEVSTGEVIGNEVW